MTSTISPARGTHCFDSAEARTGPAARGRWKITSLDGRTAEGYLPDWAAVDPSERHVPPEDLAVRLADINHHATFPGQILRVYDPAHHDGSPAECEVLHGSIDCNPYDEAPEARVPVVNLRLTDECWITDLDPDGLATLASQLRAHADRLEHNVLPQLIAARDDWTAHHPPDRSTPSSAPTP